MECRGRVALRSFVEWVASGGHGDVQEALDTHEAQAVAAAARKKKVAASR